MWMQVHEIWSIWILLRHFQRQAFTFIPFLLRNNNFLLRTLLVLSGLLTIAFLSIGFHGYY